MLVLTIVHILILARVALLMISRLRNRRPLHLRDVDAKDVLLFLFQASILGLPFAILGLALRIFSSVDYGKYVHYVFVIPYVVLGVTSVISFLVLWVVRYTRNKQEVRTTPDHEAISIALKAGRMSEAMRLYKVVNCLNEDNINAALQQVLPVSSAWSIENEIHEATSELLALQSNCSIALAAGVPQNHIDSLTEVSENALNTIWIITDRVVAVKRQNVDSPRIQRALSLQEQRIRNLAEAAREARENLAEWTLYGWEGQDIEKAQEKLNDLVTASRELMDDSASM